MRVSGTEKGGWEEPKDTRVLSTLCMLDSEPPRTPPPKDKLVRVMLLQIRERGTSSGEAEILQWKNSTDIGN